MSLSSVSYCNLLFRFFSVSLPPPVYWLTDSLGATHSQIKNPPLPLHFHKYPICNSFKSFINPSSSLLISTTSVLQECHPTYRHLWIWVQLCSESAAVHLQIPPQWWAVRRTQMQPQQQRHWCKVKRQLRPICLHWWHSRGYWNCRASICGAMTWRSTWSTTRGMSQSSWVSVSSFSNCL